MRNLLRSTVSILGISLYFYTLYLVTNHFTEESYFTIIKDSFFDKSEEGIAFMIFHLIFAFFSTLVTMGIVQQMFSFATLKKLEAVFLGHAPEEKENNGYLYREQFFINSGQIKKTFKEDWKKRPITNIFELYSTKKYYSSIITAYDTTSMYYHKIALTGPLILLIFLPVS